MTDEAKIKRYGGCVTAACGECEIANRIETLSEELNRTRAECDKLKKFAEILLEQITQSAQIIRE